MNLSQPLFLALAALLFLPATGAGPTGKMTLPDFTKGDPIPEGAKHDWNLGATGARGWIFSDKMVTSDARQIFITGVAKGSPAEDILAIGDVLLGVSGKPFSYDPRTEMGKALTSSEASDGRLSLIRWRSGNKETVTLTLPVLGNYSATAPYDCQKSQRIFEQGCQILAQRIVAKNYRENPITRSLNALALLSSGDKKYHSIVRKEVKWASDFSNDSMQTWYYGYAIILLAEYAMATGDQSFIDGLRRLSLEAANGQSSVGSWGHRFSNPDGRLAGYGMMNAPGIPLTISLVMARAAGVDDPALTRAIDQSTRLLRFYTGKGALPYGDHHPWIETHEDNGKSGMTAVLFNLLNEPKPAEFFSKMSLASHGPERDTGHTGNFFNILWSLPAVAQSGPHATGAWMEEFGTWYFDLARQWDGTFAHLGPPQTKKDSYANWDCTGAYLLAYAMPLKKIFLTGKRPSIVPQLDAETAKRIILDGRGWNNKDRTSAYDSMNGDTLLECLTSWSPVVRERAAMAFARRKDIQIEPLIKLLKASDLESRYGASQALTALRGRGAPAVDALKENLATQDLWLRIKSAEALAAIGKPAMETAATLLELMTQADLKNDPRGMQQRYFSFALFNNRGGMLSRSLDGVDRKVLFKAVRAGLKNEDGRARGSLGSVFRNLSQDEIKPLLPAILEAVENPSPSGIMFADEIRMEGLQILANHRIEEGIEACADYIRTQNPWASEKRTPRITELLLKYGTHAKSSIPALKKTVAFFAAGEKNFPKKLSLQKAKILEETIQAIESADQTPKLLLLK